VSRYSAKVAQEFCSRIAEGRSVRSVCKDADMPSKSTIFVWLDEQENFQKLYALAQEERAEAMFDDMLEIADDGSNDTRMVGREGEEREVTDHEVVARSTLRVRTRQWALARMAPKKYGDKLQAELTGKDGAPLPPVSPVAIFQLPDNARG
jgi:hypothetical protein